MFVVENIGEFNLFMPSSDIVAGEEEKRRRCREANDRYLRRRAGRHGSQPAAAITGSYVYAHAPDYYGEPTLAWDRPAWARRFAAMRADGLDTVVFQASVWHELGECYYPTRRFAGEYRCFNVVEPMLAGAAEAGMAVWLGGYGSVVGWLAAPDADAVAREVGRQLACLDELLVHGDGFAGIYFSPETAFPGARHAGRERALNRLYRDYFARLRERAPDKRIAMSPASLFTPGTAEAFDGFWDAVLDGVALDVLMPQDSVGTCGCALADMAAQWRAWRGVADRHRLRLWAHVELFERRAFGGAEPFVAAAPERVRAQLEALAGYVEKCVCFEYPYFAGRAPGGVALREALFAPAPVA